MTYNKPELQKTKFQVLSFVVGIMFNGQQYFETNPAFLRIIVGWVYCTQLYRIVN